MDNNNQGYYQNGYPAPPPMNEYQGGYQNGYQNGYQGNYQAPAMNEYQGGYQTGYRDGYQGNYQAPVMNEYQGGYQTGYQNGYPMQQPNQQPPRKKKKVGRVIGILAAILLVLFAGFVLLGASIAKKDKKESLAVIDTFIVEYNNQNLDAAYDTFYPAIRPVIKQAILASNGVSDEAQFWELYNAYFGGFHVDYVVNKSKRVTEEELEKIVTRANATYNTNMDITKAYAYQVTETYSGRNGSQVQIETIVVGKEGDNWYVIAASTDEIVSNDVDF